MFKFNKSIIPLALAAQFLVPGMSSATDSFTQDLKVSGSVIDSNSCSVDIRPSLDLGEVFDNEIKTSSQAPQALSGATTINLKNCSTDQMTFSLSLMGSADSSDTSLLANTAQSGAASNVGVGVWTWPEFNQITVGGDAVTFVKEAGVNGAGINIVVALAKPDGSKDIEPGQVESSAQFKIGYL